MSPSHTSKLTGNKPPDISTLEPQLLEDFDTLTNLYDIKCKRDPDFFEEQGKYIEKMRMALEKEKERLSDYHKYEDGTVDQPFITPDTVKDKN